MAESTAPTSATPSEFAASELPVSEMAEAAPAATFPPYPPYATEPAPPSVADAIFAGHDLRTTRKSLPRTPVRPPPKPAKPKGPKANDVKLTTRAKRAHARCLRRHGAVLSDRLERMSKPPRRSIIYLWREHADILPPDTIARLRSMLDADEPFKPDQAYEYFINLRKTKKKATTTRVNEIKKDVLAMCGDKRFVWARNATVAFARGIQQRLSRPGCYALADGMLRLSNIILDEICGFMHMKAPSRSFSHPKARFMMEVSDKIAIWIDEILSESDDRMLMMDVDEDDDVLGADRAFEDTGFADDFLNMMGGGGLLKGPQPAYLKFTGEMLEAFMILTDSMYKKGDQQLLSYGKFSQKYNEGADELKRTPDFDATEFNTRLASQLNSDLANTAKPNTPSNIAPFMKGMVDICSNYLAQHAEFNKDKGPAFRLLVKTMRTKSKEQLYQKEKARRTYGKAVTELEEARGLESDHDDPNLSQEVHSALSKLVESVTPDNLKIDMTETLDICSKYLSQCAIDEIERGPAFDILIKQLEKHGADPFTPEFSVLATKFAAAYTLKSAPGFSSVTPDPATTPRFVAALHKAVDAATPRALMEDMHEVIERCGKYLSAFVRDRDKALQELLKMMKSNPTKELAKRNNYAMDYGTGAAEIESAPTVIPFLPVKDIADEGKGKLAVDMAGCTPPELNIAMKCIVQDASRYLSQSTALRSGAAGERYPLNFLASVKKSLGSRPLFKHKSYGQTYSDAADVLKYSGPLEYDPKCEQLQHEITSEMKRGVPSRLPVTVTADLDGTMADASKHLAKQGVEKGQALDYLVGLMKEKGDIPLGNMQGYQQSYKDGAKRIENAPSLTNDRVDKGTYESVRGKLTTLTTNKPSPENAKHMPGVVEETSKFLATPMPETEEEKRQVLADLMARKGNNILGQEGIYKITYTEGGEELMQAPVGVTKAHDEQKKKVMLQKINAEIPEKKMQDLLKNAANEGAAHITDILKGRGDAMKVIHDGMKNEKDKDFLTVGKFKKTHEQAADMLTSGTHFGGQHPSPVLLDKVADRIDAIPKIGASEFAMKHMDDASSISSKYIAGIATKECGLDAKALATMDGSYFDAAKSSTSAPVRISASEPAITKVGPSPAITKVELSSVISKVESAPISTVQGSGADEEAERKRREAEEARRRREEERKRREEAEKRRLEADRIRLTGSGSGFDPEREQAVEILHKKLRTRGGEVLYRQPHTELSHAQASEWISMKPPMKVDKTVKESTDTARLHKKFERKLDSLVSDSTPDYMYDSMQDVVIESSRILSEYFVSSNYKALVREVLISEMQRRGNEILIEVDGAAETYFFAAQRLKKTKSLEVREPCNQVSYLLTKKLEDMIRCRSMARKLTASMKDHVKDAAEYLSERVTKADGRIEAYVCLLGEMEAAGDTLLIEGDIPKSYKDAASYLRQLTSYEDQIRRSNSTLQSSTEAKLKKIMANVTASGYSSSVMDRVVADSTSLLVAYIMLQGEKTEALNIMIEQLKQMGDNVLLRHGTIRKSYTEGAEMLRGKNTDQLCAPNADPVVSRKIQIKLTNLMNCCTPGQYRALMDDVIEDTTMYLAVHLLQPRVIKVCKCMKNVFVQCELWCDEILRRVARPCCTCSRHVSTQALADLAPAQRLRVSPGSSRAFAPGLEISLTQCPSAQARVSRGLERTSSRPCPALKPTSGCGQTATTSYLMYSTSLDQPYRYGSSPRRLPPQTPSDSLQTPSGSQLSLSKSPSLSPIRSLLFDIHAEHVQVMRKREPTPERDNQDSAESSPGSYHTPLGTNDDDSPGPVEKVNPFFRNPLTMFANVQAGSDDSGVAPRRVAQAKAGYISRAPIISTDQMADWHAMMVSLMWNVQAWRDWIQDNIDRALSCHYEPNTVPAEAREGWANFQRRVATEALQWRQYNIFSRQLTLRLALRYKDKTIVSPTRATNKTETYMECLDEMLEIIDMFNRWTHWLTVVIKETNSLQQVGSDIPVLEMRWSHFKKKIQEYSEDWKKYNLHLKICWEHKYRTLIDDWVPAWKLAGPVWVVSACGAVPSGAVAAGVFDAEVVWVARTTHRCKVLPAALHPSKHSCLVYADGAVHHYTKYQVLCNADVKWVAWRAGPGGAGGGAWGGAGGGRGARAVRAAGGVHVGRVHYRGSHLLGAVHAPHYRCHVVIFGRPFAFNCYELLVLSAPDDQ